MNVYTLTNSLALQKYNTEITKKDFETLFTKTNERITFTFDGWDGKSYCGESRTGWVYRTTIKGFEDVRFIKVGKGLHYIEEETDVLEKATGKTHKRASWLVDVARA